MRSSSRLATPSSASSICSTSSSRVLESAPSRPRRFEAEVEQLYEQARDPGLPASASSMYAWLNGLPRLAQVLRDRAQERDFPPGQLGAEHEPVEAVVLDGRRARRARKRPGRSPARGRPGTRRRRRSRGRSRRSRLERGRRRAPRTAARRSTFTPMFSRSGSTSESRIGCPSRSSLNPRCPAGASSGR